MCLLIQIPFMLWQSLKLIATKPSSCLSYERRNQRSSQRSMQRKRLRTRYFIDWCCLRTRMFSKGPTGTFISIHFYDYSLKLPVLLEEEFGVHTILIIPLYIKDTTSLWSLLLNFLDHCPCISLKNLRTRVALQLNVPAHIQVLLDLLFCPSEKEGGRKVWTSVQQRLYLVNASHITCSGQPCYNRRRNFFGSFLSAGRQPYLRIRIWLNTEPALAYQIPCACTRLLSEFCNNKNLNDVHLY